MTELSAKPKIYFESEKHFEDFLFENQEFMFEHFDGQAMYRQVNLDRYGICDLIITSVIPEVVDESKPISDDNVKYIPSQITIIELKNTEIKPEHFSQCAKYYEFFNNTKIDVRCCLIGVGATKWEASGGLCYLAQNIDWLSVYELEISPFEGLSFLEITGWGVGDGISQDDFTKSLGNIGIDWESV